MSKIKLPWYDMVNMVKSAKYFVTNGVDYNFGRKELSIIYEGTFLR